MSFTRFLAVLGLAVLTACSGSAPTDPGCIDPESRAYVCSGNEAAVTEQP